MRGKRYDDLVFQATVEYVSRFLPAASEKSVVVRLDGYQREEAEVIATLLNSKTRIRAAALGQTTSPDDLVMTINRATHERNAVDNQRGLLFVIIRPQAFTTIGGSLDNQATKVVGRGTVFREALAQLAQDRAIEKEFLRQLRERAMRNSDENIFLILGVLHDDSGTVPPDLLPCTIGLLPDSEIANNTELLSRLLANRNASDCLLAHNHISEGHLLAELGQQHFDTNDFESRHLAKYMEWRSEANGDLAQLHRYLDFASMKFGAEGVDFEFQPRLALSPHRGFNAAPVVIGKIVQEDRDDVVEANRTEAKSTIKWKIEPRCPARGVKFRVALRCYESAGDEYGAGEEVAQIGQVSALQAGNSRLIDWTRLIRRNPKLGQIVEQADQDGLPVFIRIEAFRGAQLCQSKDSDFFYLYSNEAGSVEEKTAHIGGDPSTLAHALYKATCERSQKPSLGKTKAEATSDSVNAVFRFGEADHAAHLDCPLGLWGRLKGKLAERRGEFLSINMEVDLARGEVVGVTAVEPKPVPATQEVTEYRRYRKEFLEFLFKIAPVDIPEALLFNKDQPCALVKAYTKAFAEIWRSADRNHAHEFPVGEQQRMAALLMSDTLIVSDPRKGLSMLLLLPTHPMAVAWQRVLFDLVQSWVDKDLEKLPPYEDLVESLRCGPRVLAYPVHVAAMNQTFRYYYAGNLAALWPIYYPDGKTWPAEEVASLQGIAGVTEGPIWEAKDSHKYLGRRLEHYADLHPFKDSLQVYCLDPGNGMEIVEAATKASRQGASLENVRLSMSLAAPRRTRDFAQSIDKMVSYPGSREWSKYAESLIHKTETILSPGFAYAKLPSQATGTDTNHAECLQATCGADVGYDISVIRSLLVPKVDGYTPGLGAVGSFRMYGLSLVPVVRFDRDQGARSIFAGDWSVGFEYDESPQSRLTDKIRHLDEATDLLVNSTVALWHLCAVSLGLGKARIPGLRVSLLPPHEEALLKAHANADWVINQDPLFSVEFLDRRPTSEAEGSCPVLLDFAPQSAPFPASQLIVSAQSTDTLRKVAQQVAQDFLQRDVPVIPSLAAISGRLLLQLSNPTKQVLGERAGLIAAHRFLRQRNEDTGFVVPLDAHREMFMQSGAQYRRMSDLLYVTCSETVLKIDVVEVKYTAGDTVTSELVTNALAQVTQTSELLDSLFKDAQRPDREYQYEKLAEILEFYRARAERHALPTGLKEVDLRNAVYSASRIKANLKIVKQVVIIAPGAGPESWPDDLIRKPRSPVVGLGSSDLDALLGDRVVESRKKASEDIPSNGGGRKIGEGVSAKSQGPTKFNLKPSTGRSPVERAETPQNMQMILGKEVGSSLKVMWDPSTLANGHFLLIGGSGAGKTTTLRHLLWQVVEHRVPTLVIDFHGDIEPYGFDESLVEFKDDAGDCHFNPFATNDACSAMRCRTEFVEALKAQNTNIGPQQGEVLTQAIDKTYRDNEGQPIDFAAVCETLSTIDLRKSLEGVRASLQAYIRPYLESRLFHGGSPLDVDRLVKGQCRLKISEVGEQSRNALTDIVLRKVFLWAKRLGPVPAATIGPQKYRLFIVLDEAQIFLKSNPNARACIAKYASEARKYGIGLILATQLFENVPHDVRGNIDAKLFMLCLDETEARKNARSAGLTKEDISRLKKGQGYYISSGDRHPRHVQVVPPWIK